jgi:hypothetical protein
MVKDFIIALFTKYFYGSHFNVCKDRQCSKHEIDTADTKAMQTLIYKTRMEVSTGGNQ